MMKTKTVGAGAEGDRLEDIIEELGRLYAEADEILDRHIAEARARAPSGLSLSHLKKPN